MMDATAELLSPPLFLYGHMPWCVRKCPYCDFNSHQLRGGLPADEYVSALIADLEQDLDRVRDRSVASVFFGGGTPSLFKAGHIESLILAFRDRLNVAADVEITLEANPGTVEYDSFAAYLDAGINRVSLGVQSFDDDLLASIGRIHGREEIETALNSLQVAGIDNFNIDLMYGLPGQRPEQALRDLELAAGAGPAHVSHYQLTLEPNTAFAAHPPELPSGERCWEMQEAGRKTLEGFGFKQYEISAWARPGRQCRHNLNYWRYGDFLGIGAGAHSKLTDAASGEIRRASRVRHPKQYTGGQRVAESRLLDAPERVFEYFLNALRLREGFTPGHFSSRTGVDWEAAWPRVAKALEAGLLQATGKGFTSTELGWRFLNDLQTLFLP